MQVLVLLEQANHVSEAVGDSMGICADPHAFPRLVLKCLCGWGQAAGFAVLVAGTLVYARGDQHEEMQLAEKHHQAKPKHRPHFRFFNTIGTPSHNTVHHHRWHAAVARVRSALHLEEGSHHT